MPVRRFAALVLVLAANACGGSASPSGPSAVATSAPLVSGSYGLTVTLSQVGEPVCEGGFCHSISLCVGSPPSAVSFTTVVQVEISDDVVSIVAADPGATFRMHLRSAGKTLTGTASGQFRDGVRQIGVDGTAAVAGSMGAAGSAGGTMDGQLTTGLYGCSNNGHTWILKGR